MTLTYEEQVRIENLEYELDQMRGILFKYRFQGASGFVDNVTIHGGYLQSENFVTGSSGSGYRFGPTSAEINVATAINSLDIPDAATANSFHVESDGDTFWGTTPANFTSNNDNATAYVLKTGVAKFQSVTLSGTVAISGIVNSTATDISLLEKTWTMVFSVTDADTIAWTSGTITLSNGRTFAIDAGNTANMAALTWIYLDPAVSSTVLQITTTAATAMGANKILIGTAQNNTVTASFIPYGPGQPLVDGANIGSLAVVAANIGNLAVTNAKINDMAVSKLTAGTITSKSVLLAADGSGDAEIRSGIATGDFENTGAASGFILGIDDSDSDKGKFYVGSSTEYLKFDGTNTFFTGLVSTIGILGDGADGDVTIGSNTTLAANKSYRNLTVSATFVLTTAGYTIHVLNLATINGTISANGGNGGNGGNASGTTPGAAGAIATQAAGATLPAGAAPAPGIIGVTGSAGNAGGTTTSTEFLGGSNTNSGVGGADGGNGGGAAGTWAGSPESAVQVRSPLFGNSGNLTAGSETTITRRLSPVGTDTGLNFSATGTFGGSSGPSGGTGGASTGASGGSGGGGAGGGCLFLAAKTITIGAAGIISSNGGNAGTTGTSSANAGGSGGSNGGGGGIIMLCYQSYTNNGSVTATGGAKSDGAAGAGAGAGTNGTVGNAGNIYRVLIT